MVIVKAACQCNTVMRCFERELGSSTRSFDSTKALGKTEVRDQIRFAKCLAGIKNT
jgi:hypothetical protein